MVIMTRTGPRTVLNSIGDSGDFCLVLDLNGNDFGFSVCNMILTVGLSFSALSLSVPSVPNLLRFF